MRGFGGKRDVEPKEHNVVQRLSALIMEILQENRTFSIFWLERLALRTSQKDSEPRRMLHLAEMSNGCECTSAWWVPPAFGQLHMPNLAVIGLLQKANYNICSS